MFFTIEPMINLGKKDIKILDDGWTAVTRDKKLSAHNMSIQLALLKHGYEVFTISEKEKNYKLEFFVVNFFFSIKFIIMTYHPIIGILIFFFTIILSFYIGKNAFKK